MERRGRAVRLRGALVLGALVVALAAGAFAQLIATEAQSNAPQRPALNDPSTHPPSGKQRDNRILLSHRESLRLVSWARALRTCLATRGVEVGEPVAYAKQIDLQIRSAGSAAELSPTITGCGDSLGEPPRRSSLQFRPGKLVLYLSRQCLLDPKVRAKRRGRDA
jgi:hypothetical protein